MKVKTLIHVMLLKQIIKHSKDKKKLLMLYPI